MYPLSRGGRSGKRKLQQASEMSFIFPSGYQEVPKVSNNYTMRVILLLNSSPFLDLECYRQFFLCSAHCRCPATKKKRTVVHQKGFGPFCRR